MGIRMNDEKNLKDLKLKLQEISKLGFIPSTRASNKDGDIGNSLEDLLKIKENNLQEPDLHGFEIKSKKNMSSAPITLFSKASAERGNKQLFNNYSRELDGSNKLFWTVNMTKESRSYDRYNCKLKFDDDTKPTKLVLSVYDNEKQTLDESIYWNLASLETALLKKATNLVVCTADEKVEGDQKYYHYKKFDFYTDLSFDKFKEELKNGNIQVDFRISVNNENSKYHDHGTAFRTKQHNLTSLYENHQLMDLSTPEATKKYNNYQDLINDCLKDPKIDTKHHLELMKQEFGTNIKCPDEKQIAQLKICIKNHASYMNELTPNETKLKRTIDKPLSRGNELTLT